MKDFATEFENQLSFQSSPTDELIPNKIKIMNSDTHANPFRKKYINQGEDVLFRLSK